MKPKLLAMLFSIPFISLTSTGALAADSPDYAAIVQSAYQKFKNDNRGKVADYIPALTAYSDKNYAIAIATVDGKLYTAGDTQKTFPLESLTKIFSLSIALNQHGADKVLNELGANSTGLPFNSGLAIELRPERPQNPLVNAGAISTVSFINAKNANDRWQQIIDNMNAYADAKLSINLDVYHSESVTNQHNQALSRLMMSYGRMYSNADEALDIYTKQCSVSATTEQLAKMGAVVANAGKSPFTGKQLLQQQYVPNVLSEMAIAGLYDGSGQWLYNVGVPAKSGVGGGMVAVVPGQYAIAVYSPPLDKAGNSVRAQEAISYVAHATKANLYDAH